MNTTMPIQITNEQWHELLEINSNQRLISSSMWADSTIGSINQFSFHLSDYCNFAIFNALEMSSKIKINFCVFWESVGSNSETDSDKKRIAHFISELPSESLLHELKTIDQLAMWVDKKNFAIRLAKCWDAGHSTPDNPLIIDMEKGLINQWKSDHIWLQASYYEQISKLLQQRGRKIIKFLKKEWDCPFKSERELLQELLQEAFDNEYSLLIKKRHIHKSSDVRKLATLCRKKMREGELAAEVEQTLTDLCKQLGGELVWHHRLAQICHYLAKEDTWIGLWLKIIKAHQDVEAAMLQASACDPKLREHGHGRSFACIDGKIYSNLRKLPKHM